MSKATRYINKLDSVLNKFAPLGRTAYKRVITRTGGDSLIGRRGTVTYSDTELTPQPVFSALGHKSVSGGHATAEGIVANGKVVTADDYRFVISPTAITQSELQGLNLQLLLKDSTSATEVFEILTYEPISFGGEAIAFVVYARSIKRP